MKIDESNLSTMDMYLRQTMSPEASVRKPAEEFLRSVEGNKNFPVVILTLLGTDSVELPVKIAGSIFFKNYIKRNWSIDEETKEDKIHAEDRNAIKIHIVDLMLKSPTAVQKQLSSSVAIIGQADFPDKWKDLLPTLTEHFKTGDFHLINGVLQTAYSIFEKYSIKTKSNGLWLEIKFVLDNFAQPLTTLLNNTMELAKTHAGNKDALKVIFGSLSLIAKIFYFLNYQDLPEFFEDNMNTWMTQFWTLLTTNNDLLKTSDDEEPGVLEELRSQICDNIGLYAFKYEEEFSPYMNKYVTAVWGLLLETGLQVKYDGLVSNAIQFLASLADRQQYKSLFEDKNILGSICEKIIVPNMEMRDVDVELFEDNPEEYIRKDLEGSDLETRRRAACDLVKGLSRYFEPQITEIFGAYVKTMLDNYSVNPAQKWKSKDAAIYLVTSLATRAKTTKHGITQTNQLVNLTEFCNNYVIGDLQNPDINAFPVLKADCIKYVLTFKSQLPPEMVKQTLPLLVNYLKAQSHVVHTYAASAIEKILFNKNYFFPNPSELNPIAERLLTNLFEAFSLPGSPENEYVMKCIMRSFSALQEGVVPFLASLLPVLTQRLQNAAKNPTRPHYNHYLFESLSLSIKIVCKNQPGAVSNFESVLFPVFQEILQQDVQEFVPYVFQILSLLLELHSSNIPGPYMELFPFLLMPVLWERPGNITPLVRLIQAYISRGPQQIVEANKLEGLLGVFQKLLASKSTDHEGFYLLQSMVEHFPPPVIGNYIRPIFTLLFQRITSSKTTKFVKSFLVFVLLFVVKFDGTKLQEVVDSIQQNMFGMVCQRLIVLEIQKVCGNIERKIVAVGITKLLCETPCMLNGQYASNWSPVLNSLIGLFELPRDESIPDDEHFIEVEDTPGYQSAYSQLIFADKRKEDPVASIPDPKIHLAQCLHKLSVSSPGVVPPLISQLEPQAQQYLQKYLQMANVNIA